MTGPAPQPDKRICIGKIVAAHGVKGLVKILPFCEDISLLNGMLYTDETSGGTLRITLKNPMGKYILAQVQGVTTPEEAKTTKCSLFVSRETLPDLDDENTFYIEDLIGLTVVNEQNETLGAVLAVQNFGAGDLLEIKPKAGESYLVPFHDDYVLSVDSKTQKITLGDITAFIIE